MCCAVAKMSPDEFETAVYYYVLYFLVYGQVKSYKTED